jgi:hypothetical protein
MRNVISNGNDFLAEKIGGAFTVFDVDAHDSDSQNAGDEPCHCGRIVRIASLDIDGERHPNYAGYVANRGNQLILRKSVPIRIAARPSQPCTRGRYRLRTQALDQACGDGIPGIRQEQ